MTDEKKGIDLLGLKPLSESIKIATQGVVDGAAAFLGRICLPVAEEFGLLLKDRVHNWRTGNIVNITTKAERYLTDNGGVEGKQVHPRLLSTVLDHGSWVDSDDVQQMWAGLLASSCTPDGRDESNLVFVSLLKQLTTAEARFLAHVCNIAPKRLSLDGLIYAQRVEFTPAQLIEIWNDQDIHRIDRELDHLRELGLTSGGFSQNTEETVEHARQIKQMQLEHERRITKQAQSEDRKQESDKEEPIVEVKVEIPPLKADVAPTAIGVHLYVRCQGCRASPSDFFKLKIPKAKCEQGSGAYVSPQRVNEAHR